MTSSNFDNIVLLEQVRCIESQQALDTASDDSASTLISRHNFDERLLQRAKHLVRQHTLQDMLSHAPRMWQLSNRLVAALAVILGAAASLFAIAGGNTINIYWLLLVLVGFNFLSMGLWLVGIATGMDTLISGVLAKVGTWWPSVLSGRQTATGQADHAWLICHFGGLTGKWRFSQITQQIWLLYLCTGLAVLVLVLMARQFDFVWGTTLLSDEAFAQLTDALGQPLQLLGFTTPSEQQVLETRIGAGYALHAEHRYSWAQFLIGVLLVFGILPRLLLWGICQVMLGLAQRHLALDYYLPYYIRLRQELMPMHGHSEIVDADTTAPTTMDGVSSAQQNLAYTLPLPAGLQWVAVEWDEGDTWPLNTIEPQDILGWVVDRESLEGVLQQLHSSPGRDIAIALAASRTPDRGIQRTIAALCAATATASLVLIAPRDGAPISTARLTAWYRLANACNVPAENVKLLSEGDARERTIHPQR